MPVQRPRPHTSLPASAANTLAPVQLEYAWSPERQRLVHIGEARAGETYLHPDPALRLPLVPHKGFLRRHHFAHHPSAAAALIAAGIRASGGEGWRHLNFKLALVHRLQQGGDLPLRWRCPICGRIDKQNLRQKITFDEAAWEVPLGDFRLDVGLRRNSHVVGALEVFDSHAVDGPKEQAFHAAAARTPGRFQAFEIKVAALPLKPPLEVRAAIPRLICRPCEERREAWRAWSRTSQPATNFSGWIERPGAANTCIALGGGWATRTDRPRDSARAGADALTPVFYWFELRVLGEREILVTALTLHRREGCLRYRELRLRAPAGKPTAELDFHLARAAQDFAGAAQKFHQRLARAEPPQLQKWLTEATQTTLAKPPRHTPSASADPTQPTASVPSSSTPLPQRKPAQPAAPATAATASTAASTPAPSPSPLPAPSTPRAPAGAAAAAAPIPPRRRLARWIDRLAHQAADWLDHPDA